MSFFRNLFHWRAATPKNPGPGAALPPAAPAVPQARPEAEPQAQPVSSPAARAEDCIPFPLKVITDLFPPELKSALRKQPSEHVEVPLPRALIQPQLATGAVRITFAQLRAITPDIFFHANAGNEDAKLLIPLAELIQRCKPARREDQRLPSIPVSIPSIFAKSGPGGALPGAATAGAAESWYTPRRPTYEPPPEAISKPAPAIPEAPPVTPAAAAPAEPAPATAPPPQAAAPIRIAIPTEPPAPVPSVAAGAASADSLTIPFHAISACVPEEIQAAFRGADGGARVFVIPVSECEPGIRAGRLRFKWSQLSGWCVPPASVRALPDGEIDLPMATVVPLFLAARRAPESRRKVEIDSRIPDVFGKTQAPAVAPEPAVAIPAASVLPAPVPEPAATPVVTPPAPQAPAATWESRPLRIEQAPPLPEPEPATPEVPLPEPEPAAPSAVVEPAAAPAPPAGPAEAVRRIREIEGVTGAFLATADGLLIAADIAEGNATILAAFAPTVFSQLSKYAAMARLGLPAAIELHLDAGVIYVRKSGKLYMGILMPPGHPLPLAALEPISAALQPH